MDYTEYLGDSIKYDEKGNVIFDEQKAKRLVNKNKDKINIVLAGATGVGKSSLVNAVFGANVTKTGVGKPVTQHLEKIICEDKGLTLWDTKGIEAADYEATKQQLIQDIRLGFQEAFKSGHDDLVPHVAWLCIKESSSRVEQREFDLLNLLKDFGIPTVVVFTDTQDEKTQDFFYTAQQLINQDFGDFIKNRFVRVNSVESKIFGIVIPKSGLEDLLALTEACLEDANCNTQTQKKKHIDALKKAQNVDINQKLIAIKKSAKNKVHLAAAAAATAGASPIPMSDAPIIAGIQATLIYTLNSEFELDAKDKQITAIITAILGVTAIAEVGKTTVANLLKFIPIAGQTIGGAVAGTTAFTITQAVGNAYIKLLEHFFDHTQGKTVFPIQTEIILELLNFYLKNNKH